MGTGRILACKIPTPPSPPTTPMTKNDNYVAHNNRRWAAFIEAGLGSVPVNHVRKRVKPWKLTSLNFGRTATVRQCGYIIGRDRHTEILCRLILKTVQLKFLISEKNHEPTQGSVVSASGNRQRPSVALEMKKDEVYGSDAFRPGHGERRVRSAGSRLFGARAGDALCVACRTQVSDLDPKPRVAGRYASGLKNASVTMEGVFVTQRKQRPRSGTPR